MNRLIGIDDLPETLWLPGERILRLPPDLTRVWLTLLDRHNLRVLAMEPDGSQACAGGDTKEATDKHFAWRFTGSCARVELAMLDPSSHMPNVTDAFAQIFAGGRVAIADLPCGSGAAAIAILTVIGELRRQSRLPREPLEVIIVGGEISEHARKYAIEGLAEVMDSLEDQAIFIDPVFVPWDVCDDISNTDLIRQLTVRCSGCGSRMLMLANFSGFLQRDGKWKDAQPQLNELFRHSRDNRSSVVWIEPDTNVAQLETGGLFSRVKKLISKLKHFVRGSSPNLTDEPVAISEAKVAHALREGQTFDVRLAVMRFDLNLRPYENPT